MKRAELKSIIASAAISANCTPEETARLANTVNQTDIVLVGDFKNKVEGKECGCPATLAGYFIPELDRTGENPWIEGVSEGVREFPTRFDSSFFRGAEDERVEEDERGVEFVRIED